MAKIKFKAKIDSNDEKYLVEGKGIYKDNKIEMIRSCKDYKINLIFEKNRITESTYQIFGGEKHFSLEPKTQELIINDKKIKIDYVLEDNNFSYVLEMEKI